MEKLYNKYLLWKPQKSTLLKINSSNKSVAFKAFRNSSSSYISNKKIRAEIFKKHGIFCYLCNDSASEIDHVMSVYSCFKSGTIQQCNSLDNLKPICSTCNQSKKP